MMNAARLIGRDTWYVGASDRRLNLFENLFPTPRGVSYNSYLITDDKTVLLDGADRSVADAFLNNVVSVLNGRALHCLVVSHMEPDHAYSLGQICARWPQVEIYATNAAKAMMKCYFGAAVANRVNVVKEGDALLTGRHTLRFYTAPMVHWPEVMVTFDETTGALFSADAFGTFGALDGAIYADQTDFAHDFLPDARRYYANIVGKYGVQVQALLNKAAGLPIEMICPLHGPIWREDLTWLIDKYWTWSRWQPEESGVLVACNSIYGHTAQVARDLAARLSEKGEKTRLMDVSLDDVSEIFAQAFRFDRIALAATTYNGGLFPKMEALVRDFAALGLRNRAFALIENGSWAPAAGKLLQEALEKLPGTRLIGEKLTLRCAMQDDQLPQLEALAEKIHRFEG